MKYLENRNTKRGTFEIGRKDVRKKGRQEEREERKKEGWQAGRKK